MQIAHPCSAEEKKLLSLVIVVFMEGKWLLMILKLSMLRTGKGL